MAEAKLTASENEEEQHTHNSKWGGWYSIKSVGLEVQPPYAQLLLNGEKSMEVRQYPLPTPLLHKPIIILESATRTEVGDDNSATVKGQSQVSNILEGEDAISQQVRPVGWCIFDRVMVIKSKMAFDFSQDKHRVPKDSPFGWVDGVSPLYGWVVDRYGKFGGTKDVTTAGIVPPPTLRKVSRRMRSLFELYGEQGSKGTTGNDAGTAGSLIPAAATISSSAIGESADPTARHKKFISDIVWATDIVAVRSSRESLDAVASSPRVSKKGPVHTPPGSTTLADSTTRSPRVVRFEGEETKDSNGKNKDTNEDIDDHDKDEEMEEVEDETSAAAKPDQPTISESSSCNVSKTAGRNNSRSDLEAMLEDAQSNVLRLTRENKMLSRRVAELEEDAVMQKSHVSQLEYSLEKLREEKEKWKRTMS